MRYSYEVEKYNILKPEKFGALLKVKDAIDQATIETGCIRFEEAFQHIPIKLAGSSWEMLAVLDYFVEEGFYTKIDGNSGQEHILVRPY